MRITCYCRHHHELRGFQVIFTITDHEGRLVARRLTTPIFITDDPKNKVSPTPSNSGPQATAQPQPQPVRQAAHARSRSDPYPLPQLPPTAAHPESGPRTEPTPTDPRRASWSGPEPHPPSAHGTIPSTGTGWRSS
jgi:hypothetical protein